MGVRELSALPSMRTLYPRVAAGSVLGPALRRVPGSGLAGRLPGLGGLADGAPGDRLPDTELRLANVVPERGQVIEYARVCGFPVRDELPVTYPHMLGFPIQLELMTDPGFPFGLLGLVHVGNRITRHRHLFVGDSLSISARAEALRPHDRGRQFDMVVEARVGGELAWRSVSTYLRREGDSSSGGSSGPRGDREPPRQPSAVWRVPADVGRRYAGVSGDSNPIHLHPLTARLFGMPRPIAHGMWLKARCLAALEGVLPEAHTAEVSFKLPLGLPATVAFSSWAEDDGHRFAVHEARSGKPHLDGAVRPA